MTIHKTANNSKPFILFPICTLSSFQLIMNFVLTLLSTQTKTMLKFSDSVYVNILHFHENYICGPQSAPHPRGGPLRPAADRCSKYSPCRVSVASLPFRGLLLQNGRPKLILTLSSFLMQKFTRILVIYLL